MRGRFVIGIAAGALGLIACGLSVIGGDGEVIPPAAEGGAGTSSEPGDDGEGAPDPPPAIDAFEAGVDASPANCNAACTNGTCDGGWCVIACKGNDCTSATCPPGVPCDVRCTGKDACKEGVDCAEATACNVLCEGTAACTNRKIRCKGEACQVTCKGKDACSASIDCDAGTCALRCLGDATCKNGTVSCAADRCSVECGGGGKNGQDACIAGVRCQATTSCDVRCRADRSCQNGGVVAVAGQTADVVCDAPDSCAGGVVTSAAESDVSCQKKNACSPGGVRCDGGQCAAHCKDGDIRFCCQAGSCSSTEDKCTVDERCP